MRKVTQVGDSVLVANEGQHAQTRVVQARKGWSYGKIGRDEELVPCMHD